MLVSEFDYELPEGLIAQHPVPQRSASRLLHLDARTGAIADLAFADFPNLVNARDVLVLNDTRVVKARLAGRKASGGKIELFVERALDARQALALIRASHPPAPGSQVFVEDVPVNIESRDGELYRVRFAENIDAVLERFGAVPLPPYIRHAPRAEDAERYQTVYAAAPGAVAAPTAGLHFDQEVLDKVKARGAVIAKVTLHVGFGTFQPVRVDQVEAHRMHSESYRIPGDTPNVISGKRVLAVGTTALRALAGLEPLTEGHIDVGGARLDDPVTDTFVPAERRHFLGRHRLHGAVGAHRHERRRVDAAVGELENAAPRCAIACNNTEFHRSMSIASP